MVPPRLLPPGLFIISIFYFTFAPLTQANQCIVGCHGMKTHKDYAEGHTYTYEFDGSSVTSVSDAEGESTVKLNAIVDLIIKPDCIHQVKLKDVKVNGAAVSQKDVENYALQFNYHDGHIDTSICAEPGDSQDSLNMKRAIISLFQSSVMQDSGDKTNHETDIFGTCKTNLEFHKDGDTLIVDKRRNLDDCLYRENMRHALIYAPYDESSDVKSSPILNSNQKIEQVFKKGILNSAKSTETYYYKPFSNGNAGAKTIIYTSLTFKSVKTESNPSNKNSLPKSLIFEAPHPVIYSSSVETISNALKAVKDEVGVDSLKDKAAEKFGLLIKVLRQSNKNDILNVYRRVKSGAGGFDKNNDKKILLDALFRTGSSESVEVAVDLMKSKAITGLHVLAFYASLPLVDHVNLPAVTSVTTLLSQPTLPRIGYLGIGQIIGKYCREHNCDNVNEIKDALSKLTSKIGNGKPGNREKENNIIAALKAIRNAKYLDDQTIDKISTVAKDKNVHTRVRVAAIEAFTAKCDMKWMKTVAQIFADKDEDSEIRIKAYLSLIECANPFVANTVKEVLDVETVYQVGSFVTSHLRHLRASTDPSKQTAKNYMGGVKSMKKFPEDFRKFSFNREFSYNIDSLGIGSVLEQNVIYSQKSFVPRSINLNLTTEMFGRSFNFLEVDTRYENVDRLIEHYFGPKGELRENQMGDFIKNGKKDWEGIYERVKQRLEKTSRGRRDVKQADLDKFMKTAKPKNSEVDEDVDIDLSVRMFGVELAYLNFREGGTSSDPAFVIEKIFDFIDRAFKEAKDFDYSVSNHMHFMDFDLIYPTGMGFPMSVGIEGNGVAHIKTNGKVDVPAIMRDPKNTSIKVGLEPNVNIAIIAAFTIDAFGSESGLKVISRMHSSTGFDLSVKMLDGHGIDINLGMPKKKQEIISVSSEVLFTGDKKAVAPKFPKGKEHSDCFEQLSTILGVTVCGHFSYPYESIDSIDKRSVYPLSGPSKFSISIENNDAPVYHFRSFYDTSKPEEKSLEMLFDTPNSRTNRKVVFKAVAACHPTEKYIQASLTSPITSMSGEIRLENNEKKKALTVSVDYGKDEYYASIGIAANGDKYKPILEYKIPEHVEKLAGGKPSKVMEAYKVEGDIIVSNADGGKKYTFDKIAMMASGKKLIGLDGSVTVKPDAVDVDAAVSHNEENLSVKLNAKRMPHGFDVFFMTVPSKDPNLGVKILWSCDLTSGLIDHKFMATYGPDLESTVKRITINKKVTYKKNENPTNHYQYLSAINGKVEMTWPAQDLATKFEVEASKIGFETEIDFKYGEFKTGAEVEFKTEEKVPENWEVGLEAHLMNSKVDFEAKHKKLGEHKRQFEGKLELPNAKYEVDTTLNYQVDNHNADIQFNGGLKVNGKQFKVEYGLDATPQKVHNKAVMMVDSEKYIDFLLDIQKGGANPHGSMNLNMKNWLLANGKFNYQNGKGTGEFMIDLVKLSRKIKGTGDLRVSGPQHVANVEILFNADKDPSKYMKFSTDSQIEKNAINSKNTIDLWNNKMEVNFKGQMQEKPNGGVHLEGDADVTLPNGRYIVFKGKQDSTEEANKSQFKRDIELIDYVKKDGESRKFTHSIDMNFVEPKRLEFDISEVVTFENFDKRNIEINCKYHIKNDSKKKYDISLSAKGSYMPKPFKFDYKLDYFSEENGGKVKDVAWSVDTSLGTELSAKGSGKYNVNLRTKAPHAGHAELALVFPSDKLRNLKYEGTGRFVSPEHTPDKFEYEYTGMLTYNDDKTVKGHLFMNQNGLQSGEKKDGSVKFNLNVLTHPEFSLETTFNHDPTKEMKKGSGTLKITNGNKEVKAQLDANYKQDLSDANVNLKASTPFEKFHEIELGALHQHNENGFWKNNAMMVVDKKKYEMKSEFEMNPAVHRGHVVLTCPEGKTELMAKINKISDTEYKGEWKFDSPKGFVTADGHVKMDNIDNLFIEVNLDSDKMEHRKIHAELNTSPGVKTGKKMVLTVTSDGKNIVTGSTSYSKREEAGKLVIEGNGNLKIGENTRSSKFSYSRKHLTQENDNEVGVAMFFNANFGPSAVVGELKLSDKEVLVFNSYCEKNKDCALFKLQSTLHTDRKSHMDHEITVEVDLKNLNVPVEFALKTSTKYYPKEMTFEHAANLYIHTSKDKLQYSTQVYYRPKESAVILTLPSRELALIALIDIPKSKTPMGQYKIDVSAYLDRKNHPNDKTSFVANGDVNVGKNEATISGEARFIYPSQPKDMVIQGKLHHGNDRILEANADIDIFGKKSQKITITANLMKNPINRGYNVTGGMEIASRGQQLKVDVNQHFALSASEIGFGSMMSYTDLNQKVKNVGVLFSLNKNEGHFLIQALNKDIWKEDVTMEFTKNSQKIYAELKMLDYPPSVVSIEAQDFNSFKYQSYQKNKPNTKLLINGRFLVGQVAEVTGDWLKEGETKNLFNVGVRRDDKKLFKPDWVYNKENLSGLMDLYRKLIKERKEKMQETVKAILNEVEVEFKDLIDHLKKAQPNWKPAIDYYQNELNKLKEELNADATIKEIQATLNKVIGGLITAVTETLRQLAERMNELNKHFHEVSEKINEAVKSMVPPIKDSMEKIWYAAMEVVDAANKLAVTYMKAIMNILNEHQKEIKDFISAISEPINDIARDVIKIYMEMEKEIGNLVKTIVQQLKALPIYEMAKEKYQQLVSFKIPETIITSIDELFGQLKKFLPTQEVGEFFSATYSYIRKHLKQQKVDDSAEIKNIYSHLIDAVYSLIELLKDRGTLDKFYGLLDMKFGNELAGLKNLPGLPVLKASVINLIRNHELPTLFDLYYAYRPTLYPSDIMPPFSKMGIVVDGGHFFTFDGRHLTMPGTCDYVLAQDTKDGNFSIVGSFNNGKLISVTITAPGESITLKSNGNILVDNKPAEYPASTKNLHAFLTPPIVNVKSDYGVHLACSPKAPMICSVLVSGFYHGRLRGIFGNADNEPYDDFTLPNGRVTERENEFGNSYKLNPGCPPAVAVDHKSANPNPTCSKYFGWESSLSPCFNYVNPSIYHEACLTAANSPKAACLLSAAYYAACRKENVFVSIPSECSKCKVGKDEVAIGDNFSVKIPKKEADIVFVVEQDTKNEKVFKELITPLITQLKTELGHHGISDVHIGLIGYGEHMKWPQHYTTNGNINIDGDVKNMKFEEGSPMIKFNEAKEGDLKTRLKYAAQRLDVELGTFKLTGAYEEAIHYPFRPGAAKAVVGVIASPCEKSPLPLSLQHLRLFMGQKVYHDLGLNYYHIGFLHDILGSGKPQKNIVGYDSKYGYTFGDNKKKPLEGSLDSSNIFLTSRDVCAGFAISSGGAAFSANQFMDAKPNQRNQFLQVTARRLAEGLTNTEIHEDCMCKQQFGLDGRAYCKITGRKEKVKA